MLLAEYDYETDIAVQRAEEHEIAFAEGIEQGIEQGIEPPLFQAAGIPSKELVPRAALQTAHSISVLQWRTLRKDLNRHYSQDNISSVSVLPRSVFLC